MTSTNFECSIFINTLEGRLNFNETEVLNTLAQFKIEFLSELLVLLLEWLLTCSVPAVTVAHSGITVPISTLIIKLRHL
jgi:hypothetical protein